MEVAMWVLPPLKLFDTEHLWTDRVHQALDGVKMPGSTMTLEWSIKAGLCHFALGIIVAYVITRYYVKAERTIPGPGSTIWTKLRVRIYGWIGDGFIALTALFGGIMGLVPDIDHVSLFRGHPSGRIAHPTLLIIGCIFAPLCIRRLRKLRRSKAELTEKGMESIRNTVCLLVPNAEFIVHVVEDFILSWF